MSVMSEFSIGDSREQLTEQFVELVEQINQSMHCTPSEGWVELDLTISQIRVLALLYQGQERMGNIASYLGCIMSSATSIIDRLVDKQLVARLPGSADRRVVVCELTPLGRETMEQFWSIGRRKIVELADQLDASELKEVVHAVGLINRAAQMLYPKV